MPSRLRVFSTLCGSSLVFSAFLAAQTATTSLRGTVYDSKGAVIAGAAVTVTNPATGFKRGTKTNAQGEYQLLELPPATYEADVSAKGFANIKQTGIPLVATLVTLNFTEEVSGGTVVLEVQGTAPLVNDAGRVGP